MKRVLLAVMVSAFTFREAFGGAVEWGVATWEYDTGYFGYLDEYKLDIITSIPFFPPYCISANLRTKMISTSGQASFENFRYSGGWDCAFLQVTQGMLIDNNLFANNTDKWLPYYEYIDGWPYYVQPFIDPNNMVIPKTEEDFSNTVILAFSFYTLAFSGEYQTDYYGCIEFGYDGTEVFIVNSAIETTPCLGIVAGIPEPSSALLALSGLAVFLLRRRRIT